MPYSDMDLKPLVQPKNEMDIIREQIQSFITLNCVEKTEGLMHYLCEFEKMRKIPNAYLLNSEFFKEAKILGEGNFGTVYDSGFWTIDIDSDTVQDIIVKTQKLGAAGRPDPLFEAYINFVLINAIILKTPDIGLVPTFGLFYCGRKDKMICVNEDGTKIDENTDIFIVQQKKDASPLSKDKKFNENMMMQLFEILVKLEEFNIYHGDISVNNILVDSSKKIYLIDFGLASFPFPTNGDRPQKQKHQRLGYFRDYEYCSAFDDFFEICAILSQYNPDLYSKISPLLISILGKFKPSLNLDAIQIEYPFSFYLREKEKQNGVDKSKEYHSCNIDIYNEYTMKKIHSMVTSILDPNPDGAAAL